MYTRLKIGCTLFWQVAIFLIKMLAILISTSRPCGMMYTVAVLAFLMWSLITYDTHTHTQPFNGPFSRTIWVSRYQKGKTNLDFSEARDGEWQWHQLGHMQVCTLLQTDNRARTPPLSFLQAGCPSCRPTNSVKALKAVTYDTHTTNVIKKEM